MSDEENYRNAVNFGLSYMDTFTDDSYSTNYIKHYGVEGMKWGVENGPPYPLEGQGKKDFMKQRKEVRAEKRRQKILHNPKLLAKNAHLFTKDEIDAANDKYTSIKKAKDNAREDAKKTVTKLSKYKSRLAKDPMSLEKNASKFTPEEMELALKQLDTREKIWSKKMAEIDKPRQTADAVNRYVRTAVDFTGNVVSGANNIMNARDMFVKSTGKGLTLNDKYDLWKVQTKAPNGDTYQSLLDKKKVSKKKAVEYFQDNLSDSELARLRKEFPDLFR